MLVQGPAVLRVPGMQQATLGELKKADAPIMSLFTNADGSAVVDLKKFYVPK